MKKNQSGVSMVSLVITIIVIIILAAVAFSGSQETIGRAGFSGFATDIDSVRTAFITEGVTALMGEQTQKNNSVNEAQAYNYLAKGATEDSQWLSKGMARAIQCTRIEPTTAKAAIGIELPERTVNTYEATNVPMSYYVTNAGDIFVWPPYERSDEGLFYVNDTIAVTKPDGTVISGDAGEAEMYTSPFSFKVNDVTVTVNDGAPSATSYTSTTLAAAAGVYYTDAAGASAPTGLETIGMISSSGDVVAR